MISKRLTTSIALALPAIALAGCSGGADENTYAISVADAKARISSTQSEWKSGSQTRTMRSAGAAEEGIRVRLSHAGTFASSCRVLFEAIDENATRITPECGEDGSALAESAAGMVELEIAAHVRQILTGEPIDGTQLGKQMSVATLKNLPKMQSEGFAVDEDFVERRADMATKRVTNEQDGWGDDAASDPDAGGWGGE